MTLVLETSRCVRILWGVPYRNTRTLHWPRPVGFKGPLVAVVRCFTNNGRADHIQTQKTTCMRGPMGCHLNRLDQPFNALSILGRCIRFVLVSTLAIGRGIAKHDVTFGGKRKQQGNEC